MARMEKQRKSMLNNLGETTKNLGRGLKRQISLVKTASGQLTDPSAAYAAPSPDRPARKSMTLDPKPEQRFMLIAHHPFRIGWDFMTMTLLVCVA